MSDKSPPQRTVERKKREAAALKANIKKRKEQARAATDSAPSTKANEGESEG